MSFGLTISKDVKHQIRTSALAFLSFLNKSVTPFHGIFLQFNKIHLFAKKIRIFIYL